MDENKKIPGTGGDKYIPYEERAGEESKVYFTRDLSAEGLRRIFARVGGKLTGRVAVKLHTGEAHGPNIIPRPWVEALMKNDLPGASHRGNQHLLRGRPLYHRTAPRNASKYNGWTFCPVDIMDEDGTVPCCL